MNTEQIVFVSAAVNVVLLLALLVVSHKVTPSELFNRALAPGTAYSIGREGPMANMFQQLRNLASPLTAISLPAGIFLWTMLRRGTRLLVVFGFVLE